MHLRGKGALALSSAAVGLLLWNVKPAKAEFEIQEATIEQGSIEFEYRGALHWDLPDASFDPLRQSHELEFQMGVTDWWMLSVAPGLEQPLGENLKMTSLEVQTQVQVLKRKGDGLALAVQAGYQQALVQGDANATAFGPIVEVVNGPISLILDPLFTKQLGEFADQEGLGFEYGWQLKYELRARWALALGMFGEIDDLANAGPFAAQNHSLGPTLYYTFGGAGSDEAGKVSAGEDKTGGDAPDPSQLTVGVGLQFGLTEATSDVALKLDGQFEF
jgi:hypothetical protein